MMNSRTTLITILLALAMMAACGPADGEEKPNVVISLSHTSPDTAYWKLYAEWLEQRALDGVVLAIDPRDAEWNDEAYWQGRIEWARGYKDEDLSYLAHMYERPREKGSLSWTGGGGLASSWATGPWNPANKWTDKTISKALADLQATKPKKFKWNLIIAGCMGPTTNWFNDQEWAQRCHNFAMFARLARRAGLKGIMFDDEEYGAGCVWDYGELRRRGAVQGKTLAEVQAKVRQRGREFARAICREFPNIVLWTLHGYSTSAALVEWGLPEYGRQLQLPFFDGMLEGSSEAMVFVDGGELAYGYNTKEQFEHGRKMVLEEPIRMGLTKVPELHRQKVRCGFGVWPDYYGKIDPDNPENSYFSPGRFQRALYWALQVSDGYVWLWGEHWSWWVEGPDDRAPVDIYQGRRGLPLGYRKALEAARTSSGRDTSPVRGQLTTNLPTQGRNSCIEGSELAELLKKTEKVYELPVEGWTFKQDDWGSWNNDPKTFDKPIAIGKTWDQQGFDKPDTIGLYRLEFRLPARLKGRKLHFYFPDVDGSIWVAGTSCPRPQGMAHRYIGLEPQANRKPFILTRPDLSSWWFIPGEPASIVIKVQAHNKAGGGILAPIQVLAE